MRRFITLMLCLVSSYGFSDEISQAEAQSILESLGNGIAPSVQRAAGTYVAECWEGEHHKAAWRKGSADLVVSEKRVMFNELGDSLLYKNITDTASVSVDYGGQRFTMLASLNLWSSYMHYVGVTQVEDQLYAVELPVINNFYQIPFGEHLAFCKLTPRSPLVVKDDSPPSVIFLEKYFEDAEKTVRKGWYVRGSSSGNTSEFKYDLRLYNRRRYWIESLLSTPQVEDATNLLKKAADGQVTSSLSDSLKGTITWHAYLNGTEVILKQMGDRVSENSAPEAQMLVEMLEDMCESKSFDNVTFCLRDTSY